MQAEAFPTDGLAGAVAAEAVARLEAGASPTLSGLAGSGQAWWVATLAAATSRPVVWITESLERAERHLQDLRTFCGARVPRVFPHWDTLPYDRFSPQLESQAQRMEAMAALQAGEPVLLVVTAQALMQGTLPPRVLRSARISLAVGGRFPRSELLAALAQAGYLRVDLVEAAGEFSARGDIVDVFPPHLPHPVRLDFFDDELEAIRLFEVEAQKSFESLEAIDLMPAGEAVVNAETTRRALAEVPHHKSRASADAYRETYALIERGTPFPGCEQLLPLYYDELGWLEQLLPPETLVLLDEPARLESRLRDAWDEVLQEYELSLQQGALALPPEMLYRPPEACQKALARMQRVPQEPLRVEGGEGLVFPFADNHALRSLATASAAGAQGALTGLVTQLRRWRDGGAEVFLAARSQTAAERLRHVLIELELATALEQPAPEELRALVAAPPVERTSDIRILWGPVASGLRVVDAAGETRFALVTEAELMGEKARPRRVSKSRLQHFISSLGELREGDTVVHVEYGLGRYEGLQRIRAGEHEGDFLLLTYAGGDKVYVPVDKFNQVQKYTGLEGTRPTLSRLGDGAWQRTKQKAAKYVKELAAELVRIHAARKAHPGHGFLPDPGLMAAFEEDFPYTETDDQQRAIEEVYADMGRETPMDRLVCGDVGYGKTEVAMRAAFLAAQNGKQTLILVPTTILAQQHYETLRARFDGFPVRMEAVSRLRSPAEQKRVLREFATGEVDILIGTHRLLSKDVQAKDLGLLVVDEEQRFGVAHKERIKQLRTQVDVLTLSATPIPRTLHMALMGVRDLSIINTPPMDRIAIRTRLVKASDYIIREAIQREMRRGGQVFVVHNRVETIHAYGHYLQSIVPEMRLAVAHGQMAERELEKVMLDFVEGEVDVLLSTSIIESGLDIPRANTILIDQADRFGLAQLYQMRGRVGRSHFQAYAYLLVSPEKVLTEVAQKRLSLLQELNDLGAGFRIASHDLEIRGAGNLLGREQSGNINAVGLEMFTQMVEDAVADEQGKAPPAVSRADLKLDLGFDFLLPDDYIESTRQRLDLYKQLADVDSEEALWAIRENLEDRYGQVPESMNSLLTLVRVRIEARACGLASLERVGGELVATFADAERVDVERLMTAISQPGATLRLLPGDRLSLGAMPATPDAVLERLRHLHPLVAERAA